MDHDEVENNDGNLDQMYTLDEALSVVGFGRFQVLVLCYAGLGSIAEAMEVMILSFVGPAVKSQWELSSAQESLITTVVFAGMLVGAYSWGIISDNYGRRKGLLSVAIVTTISAFLSTFSPDYITLIILRVFVGVGLGGGPVYSAWFLEFVPAQKRGTWMVIFSTFWSVGTILEASLAWIIMPRLGWRWLLALSSIPSFAALILYGYVIESPRYLYMRGKMNDVHNILKKMAILNQTELPSGMLVSDRRPELDEEFAPAERIGLLSSGSNEVTFFKAGFSSVIMLFSSTLVKTTLLLWVVYFGNSFAYYGIILLTSEISSGQSECGPATLNSKISDDASLYRDVFITSFAELPGLILSAIIVDFLGRKRSMALMYLFSFIFLLPLFFKPQHEFLTTGLLFGARMFVIGTFTIVGIYCPEIYPTAVRSTGYGVASAVGRIGGMICPLVAVQLVTGCHLVPALIFFEVVIALSGICVMLFPFETKGRKLTDTVAACNSS
ncbi:organic cation/carnitine transporter 7 isoform X1 [Coffea arabica]|uniref:Organic cation/carnitine transporter 7 isoform X1 n=1 Tax=Coffea arabica TaxID=13443 RepID=A0A6P6SS11_COFAR